MKKNSREHVNAYLSPFRPKPQRQDAANQRWPSERWNRMPAGKPGDKDPVPAFDGSTQSVLDRAEWALRNGADVSYKQEGHSPEVPEVPWHDSNGEPVCDCTDLVSWATNNKKEIPGIKGGMADKIFKDATGTHKMYAEVAPKDAKPGDLVVWPTHAGIIDSNGKVIDASESGRGITNTANSLRNFLVRHNGIVARANNVTKVNTTFTAKGEKTKSDVIKELDKKKEKQSKKAPEGSARSFEGDDGRGDEGEGDDFDFDPDQDDREWEGENHDPEEGAAGANDFRAPPGQGTQSGESDDDESEQDGVPDDDPEVEPESLQDPADSQNGDPGKDTPISPDLWDRINEIERLDKS